jgi:lipopolysaccharide heptosyltransferase II
MPMIANGGWADARNILCIRLDSLGDVLMTSPAIRALKECRPGRMITLLTSTAGAAVAPLLEEIDQTLVYDPPWMKASATSSSSEPDHQMIERLKRPCFDAAIIFTAFSQSPLPAALMAFLADIPLRLAYCRENPYQLLTDWLPEGDRAEDGFEMRHEVRRQLDLVASAGCRVASESIRLSLPDEALERARLLLDGIGLDATSPWIIVHPGATASSRRYPAGSFAEAAQQLADQHGIQILFTGSEPETELVGRIRSQIPSETFSLAGQLDLAELAAVISLAPLLVSNNSGPVHLAAGVGTPVVDLYALTNPQHTPWMVPHRTVYHDVPCRFCYKSTCPMEHHNCLRLVSPETVVDAALALMKDVRVHRVMG